MWIPETSGSDIETAELAGFERMDDRVHVRGYVGFSFEKAGL
jgi:hypothetical protein